VLWAHGGTSKRWNRVWNERMKVRLSQTQRGILNPVRGTLLRHAFD
jgi:hypothetical protein